MKKIVIILSVVLAVVVVLGIWQIGVDVKSKKYNLISIDTSDLPEPLSGAVREDDIELEDFTMHYAVYGKGEKSVILIHGNANSHKLLEEIALYLGNGYTVYAPDSRCHGESTDPGVISYKLMAKDIHEFIEKMKLDKPYIMGHSDGGITALTFAYMYPGESSGIISCGANSEPSTFKPYFTGLVWVTNLFHKDKLNDMMLTLPDFTQEEFGKITDPVYIVAGEFDIMWLSDSVYIHESIPNSKIIIARGENHTSYMTENGKKGYAVARMCLDDFEGRG